MYSSGSDMSEYVVTEQSFARAAIVHTPLMEDSLMNRSTRNTQKHLLCYHYYEPLQFFMDVMDTFCVGASEQR